MAAIDKGGSAAEAGLAAPSSYAFAVTPANDTDLLYVTRSIYVGGTGDLVVTTQAGEVTFAAVPAGAILPVRATQIQSTGTTATNIVGLA